MEQREVVAALYVLGALTTLAGVLMAYRQAVRQKRRLDELAAMNATDEEPDFAATFDQVLADKDDEVAREATARAAKQAEIEQALIAVGIEDRPPTWNDMRLPVAYWSKRSALADTVASFRSGGIVALVGLLLSTIASVWSLYL